MENIMTSIGFILCIGIITIIILINRKIKKIRNWGYTTPLQERFQIGSECKITHNKMKDTIFEVGEIVYIIETARHDYLVKNKKGVKSVVYQFELKKN